MYEQLAEEAGAQAARLQAEFEARLAQSASRPAPAAEEVWRLARRAGTAAQQVLLDEAATRRVIDAQLQQAGWEADSTRLTHAAGARPERGRFRAIAEWPTFIPFAYASNGRPLVRQLPEASGTGFRDLRSPAHAARALPGFHSPQGLLDQLTRSREEAEAKLRDEGFNHLHLRDYQQRAVEAVEAALAAGRNRCLLAMATGTGKTRTVIALIYRLLKASRFRRILFLVDRSALRELRQGSAR